MNEALMAAFIAMALALVEGFKYAIGRLKERDAEKKAQQQADKDKKDGKPVSADDKLNNLLELVSAMRTESADLHKWHAVDDPAQPGVKVWWNTDRQQALSLEMDEKLDALTTMLASMRDVHRTCNEGQIDFIQKMRDENEALRRRIDELHELRVADRDTLYERVIGVTESFSRRIEEGISGTGTGSGTGPVDTTGRFHKKSEQQPSGEDNGEEVQA